MISLSPFQIRCMTLKQFEDADTVFGRDRKLYFVVDVRETKKKYSPVVLSVKRQKQLHKYRTDIRMKLTGQRDAGYLFGGDGGRKMVCYICVVKFHLMVKCDFSFRIPPCFQGSGDPIGCSPEGIRWWLKIS